ncbi:MAG: hypothetical protein KAR39_10570 [Thermoplasmata archaeon]|nr:hypothetical protein [Thermoplasmata archaeon]
MVIGAPPEEPETNTGCWGGTSERTVIVEKFTADWCQFCPSQAFALNRLHDELGTDNIVVLEHHPSGSDAIYYAPSNTRRLWYGVTGYPTMIVDGGGYYNGVAIQNGQNGATLWSSGGTTKWQRYWDDRDAYQVEKDKTANMTITLTGNITSAGGRMNAHIYATDPIPETSLKVRFVVYESNIHLPLKGGGENYLHHRVYNHVVRLMLSDHTIPDGSFNQGDSIDVERTFTINAGWDIRTLGIAAFVQTDNPINFMYGNPPTTPRTNYAILQGAAMDFVPTGVLVVDGNDADNFAWDFDHYDEILTKGAIPHRNWDTYEPRTVDTENDNVRTMPSFTEIEDYRAVIWFESSDTNTLYASSRTALQSYLDAKGNLLITGEDIAYDASSGGWTTWLGNYLHATYVNDNGMGSNVDGILSDPITDGIVAMGITHTSPDVIGTSGSSEIFIFSASPMDIAAVRADHDTDSRVVYDAFDYFEATDIWDGNTQEEDLMRAMLDWMDGATPPDVDVLQPDGGEVIDKVTDYEIHWLALDVEMPETPVSIDYALDSGAPVWVSISTNEPNDGVYLWTTPNADTTKARVRVCAVDMVGQSNCVISDADFTIGAPTDTAPPEVFAVRLNGKVTEIVNPGDPVVLTAILDDDMSGPAGANYTIDAVLVGPMNALDGFFDTINETATATIDTSGWAEAIYSICVTDAVDYDSNVNTTNACASLEITLTPIDNDPPEIYALVDGQPSVLVPSGALVTLDARLMDKTQVDGANYTVGAANWPGTPLSAMDGAFDEADENVTTTVDTTGWAEASYDICVYAWDSMTNFNVTGSCPQIIVSSDFYPPEIYDVFINGAPTQSWDYDTTPPDFFLTATVDDSTTGNNNIGEANYTVGPSNWPGTKMFPIDMIYNNPVEDVQQIVTTPSQPGMYEYCVYAYDDKTNTNWTGSCATLYILDPDPPIVLNVLVNGSVSTVVPIGTPVTLEATVDDTGTGNSNILSANYTDGAANWATSTPLLATDGTYDGPVEGVTILIDTTTWTLGLHDICVYGEDIYGNADLTANQCAQMDIIAFGPIPPIMMDAQLTGVGLADVLVTWQASGDDGTGLDNVVEYEIYTSNIYGGPYSLVTTIPAVDQATYQYTCTGCGYGDPDNHFFYVRAFNGIEYSASPNKAGKFTRHLTVGQHLVSVPLVTSDTSIGSVLQTIQFDKAWTYVAADTADPWKSYNEVKPYKGDLWNIDHTQAFWVNVLVEDDWVVAGLVPVFSQMQLYAGWNLVSFPSFNPLYTVGQLKLDIAALDVEGYDPGVPYCLTGLGDLDMITAGKGFWIYVAVNTVWDIIQ